MAKKGRPFTYQSDEERPVTISLRLAHDLYDRLERYASRHRQSVSELVRDGIELRLAVEADPRWQTAQEQESYYDNTVLRELATPAHFLDDRIPFDDDHMPAPAPTTGAVAIGMALEEEIAAANAVKQREAGKQGGRGKKKENLMTNNHKVLSTEQTTRAQVGKALGMSGTTYTKAKAVVAAAESATSSRNARGVRPSVRP